MSEICIGAAQHVLSIYVLFNFGFQALSAALLELNRKFGLRTSGLQFLFWFFLLICGIPQLRGQIHKRHDRQAYRIEDSYEEYYFTSYLIFYIASLAIWILNCYADREPLQTKYPMSKVRLARKTISLLTAPLKAFKLLDIFQKPYPELGASFLSRLLFAWFDPLAWKGYRNPLEQDDLWDMNPEDSSKEIMPIFMKHWEKSVAKAAGNDP